ncbi:hypothetical protein Misp06_02648 [Microbulbifer sp. NBRC 101763]
MPGDVSGAIDIGIMSSPICTATAITNDIASRQAFIVVLLLLHKEAVMFKSIYFVDQILSKFDQNPCFKRQLMIGKLGDRTL